MIRIALILNNFENNFVAVGALWLENCRYEYPEIRQTFSDKILEYNWQEDQSDLTAIYILRDAIVELSDGEIDYTDVRLMKDNINGEIIERSIDFVKNNFIKGLSRDQEMPEGTFEKFSFISFCSEDKTRLSRSDIVIVLSKEDGEEVR